MGSVDAVTAQLAAYEPKRYTVENFEYIQESINPTVKFFVWNSQEQPVPLVEAVVKSF